MTAIAELERVAANVVRPAGRRTLVIVEAGTPGGRLPDGNFSGIGGATRWGPAWFDGLRRSAPIALFDTARDARTLAQLIESDARPALRPAPHSVAGSAAQAPGPAERGAAQSAVGTPRRSAPGGRRSVPDDPKASPNLTGMPAGQDAGLMPGAASAEASVAEASTLSCAACGRDMSDLPPSRTGQRRKTCGDACRKAYQRGHRAPVPGVVTPGAVAALSRLPRHLSGFGHGDPSPAVHPAQLPLSPLEEEAHP